MVKQVVVLERELFELRELSNSRREKPSELVGIENEASNSEQITIAGDSPFAEHSGGVAWTRRRTALTGETQVFLDSQECVVI